MTRGQQTALLCAIALIGALLACKKTPPAEDKSESGSASGDKIGIQECDDFLEKYEKCVTTSTKIPTEAQESYKSAIQQMRDAYKASASNPAARPSLRMACQQSLKATREAMKSFDCEW